MTEPTISAATGETIEHPKSSHASQTDQPFGAIDGHDRSTEGPSEFQHVRPGASPLCSQCASIFSFLDRQQDIGVNGFDHLEGVFAMGSLGEWRDRVQNESCHVCCLMFYEALEKGVFVADDDPDCNVDFEVRGFMFLNLVLDKGRAGSSKIRILKGSRSESAAAQAISKSTLSPATIAKVRNWMSWCLEQHEECATANEGEQLPHRLLEVCPVTDVITPAMDDYDISSRTLQNIPQVRLIRTEGLQHDTQYLTLSHCWGVSGPGLLLTSETSADLLSGTAVIDALLASGSTTIRDAIHITRCLGFRYLWIDALCIKQDDEQDKAREIARMHHIYAQATMNLAATGACDPSEGMVFERAIYGIAPYEAPAKGSDQIHKRSDERWSAHRSHRYEEELECSEIYTRGWVYQERLLAPRVVHFGRERLHFECKRTILDEFDIVPDMNLIRWDSIYLLSTPMTELSRTSISAIKFRHAWWSLCCSYIPTVTKFERDRTMAFSAIARRVCEIHRLDPELYIAGFWKPDLTYHLDFGHSRPCSKTEQFSSYIAPSWSWLGHKGVLKLSFLLDDSRWLTCTEIVDIAVETACDPFGVITSGYLRVAAPLLPWRRISRRGFSGQEYEDDRQSNLRTAAGVGGLQKLDLGATMRLDWDSAVEESVNDEDQTQDILNDLNERYHLLPLHSDICFPRSNVNFGGLVLKRMEDSKGIYRRVGQFTIHVPVVSREMSSDDVLQLLARLSSAEAGEYLEYRGNGIYLVEIW